jgi:hypothetical protein
MLPDWQAKSIMEQGENDEILQLERKDRLRELMPRRHCWPLVVISGKMQRLDALISPLWRESRANWPAIKYRYHSMMRRKTV